jgi:hypothetical protein
MDKKPWYEMGFFVRKANNVVIMPFSKGLATFESVEMLRNSLMTNTGVRLETVSGDDGDGPEWWIQEVK